MAISQDPSPWQQPNILGQVFMNFYATILLGFRLPKGHSPKDVETTLQSALSQLRDTFPFLGGHVVIEHRTAHGSGVYKVVPYEDSRPPLPLDVTESSKEVGSFDQLASARAPMSMLKSEALAPFPGLPHSFDPLEKDCPVLSVRLNILEGGYTITFSTHHNVIDMNGLGNLINLFAKACRGQPFTQEDKQGSQLDTSSLLPLLSDGETQLSHDEFRCASRLKPPQPQTTQQLEQQDQHKQSAQPEHPQNPRSRPQASWRYHHFKAETLLELKSQAVGTRSSGASSHWISTNDALTAFIWQRVSVARTARLQEKQPVKVMRMVNGTQRAITHPSKSYMGVHGVPILSPSLPLAFVSSALVGELAAILRERVQSVDARHMRSWASLISDEPDKSTINAAAAVVAGVDLIFSSWAGLNLASLDFGLPSRHPAFVRRPNFDALEGLCYFMPKSVDGGIDVALALSEQDWEVLERDGEWSSKALLIG